MTNIVGKEIVRAEAKPDEEKKKRYAMDSYGAHFCEVAVDATIGTVTVRRFTSVYSSFQRDGKTPARFADNARQAAVNLF